MRNKSLLSWLATLSLLCSLSAVAQNRPADLEPIPEPPRAPAGMPDDPVEPQVTIIKKGDDKVEEYRVNGKLYMVKVTPPHGVPYVMIDQRGDGSWIRQDAADPTGLRVPQWVVHSW